MERLLKKVYGSQRLHAALMLLSYLAVGITAVGYVFLLWGSLERSPLSALKVLLITALPYLAVTLIRRRINAPRPYELYDFYEHRPRREGGKSFPSRHAFSIFIIGTVALFPYPIMGCVILALGVYLATARVLLGLHFVRDVVAGALSGIVCGALGVLISNPF